MDGVESNRRRRLLHDGHGRHASAILIWFVPLTHKATDKAHNGYHLVDPGWSGAVSSLIGFTFDGAM